MKGNAHVSPEIECGYCKSSHEEYSFIYEAHRRSLLSHQLIGFEYVGL